MAHVNIPVDVTSAFDQSPSLHRHTELRMRSALRPYVAHITHIRVRLVDVNGPRGGPDDKVTRVDVTLHPSGRVRVEGIAGDLRSSVARASARARTAVARHVRRLRRRLRTSSNRPPLG